MKKFMDDNFMLNNETAATFARPRRSAAYRTVAARPFPSCLMTMQRICRFLIITVI